MPHPLQRHLASLLLFLAPFAGACDSESDPDLLPVEGGTETAEEMSTGGTTGGDDDHSALADAGAVEPEPCATHGESRPCGDDDAGLQFCDGMSDEYYWGICLAEVDCMPGDVRDCDGASYSFTPQYCYLDDAIPRWDTSACA